MVKRERVLSYGRMTAKNYQLLFNKCEIAIKFTVEKTGRHYVY